MRRGFLFATALSALLPAGAAHAEDWCGYGVRDKSPIECGYSTVAQCESAVGKGGMCFLDPEYARNGGRRTHVIPANFTMRRN
jgi:hypothetical protein